jgi:hypothetical protein
MMADLNHNPDEFYTIPVQADTSIKEKRERYEEQVAEAKARMKAMGFKSLLDTPVTRQAPTLRRRIS